MCKPLCIAWVSSACVTGWTLPHWGHMFYPAYILCDSSQHGSAFSGFFQYKQGFACVCWVDGWSLIACLRRGSRLARRRGGNEFVAPVWTRTTLGGVTKAVNHQR